MALITREQDKMDNRDAPIRQLPSHDSATVGHPLAVTVGTAPDLHIVGKVPRIPGVEHVQRQRGIAPIGPLERFVVYRS